MDFFAGLDISMDETRVWVLDREGEVVYENKTESTAQAIANELAKAPSCRRIVFETGRKLDKGNQDADPRRRPRPSSSEGRDGFDPGRSRRQADRPDHVRQH
jgi:hypothetical protein